MSSSPPITNAALTGRTGLAAGASVGLALPHDSAAGHVRGTAAYVDDLPEPAGTVHVAPGCAGAARGAIRSMDLDAVHASPGVLAVLTAADIPGTNDCSPAFGDDPILAAGEVRFHGQVVFAVAAETRDAARRAARRACVEVDARPPVVTVDQGLAAGAEVLGAPLRVPARRAGARDRRRPAPARRPGADRRPGALLSRGTGRPRGARRGRRDAGPLLDPAPFGGAAPRRPDARGARRCGGVRVPADGRRVRRQGVAGGAVGVPRGARRARDRPPGEAAPRPRRRHGDDRQASRLPRGLALRLRPRRRAGGRRRRARCPLRVLGGPLPRG